MSTHLATFHARFRQSLGTMAAVLLAAAIWLPCMHLCFRRSLASCWSDTGVPPMARKLAATHLAVWSDPVLRERELAKMRERNPEWDFMSRTYFVLSLANMAKRNPAYRSNACVIIDAIIDHTLDMERTNGFEHFLLSYGHGGGWVAAPPRSLFIDGEIALMIGARRLIEEKAAYKQALAALRMQDVLDGTDHSAFLTNWIATAKRRLADPKTGLLISAFGVNGTPAECGFSPEGSTIWMAAHMLQAVDPAFAQDQYRRAKKELARSWLGFGYSREWPEGLEGSMDVDSGPVIPVLGASVSASGLAIMAAAAFGDTAYLSQLLVALDAAGFPETDEERLRYCAGNQVGDAVLLYALTQGPLWAELNNTRRDRP